jgi:hypothetical protein
MQKEAVPVDGHWRNLLWVRLLSFSLAVIGVLILLVLIFPSASIEMRPQIHEQNLSLTMYSSTSVDAVDINGYVPSYTVSMPIKLSQTIQVTGSEQIPDQAASGTVVFSNLTTGSVSIPIGTVVSTVGNPPVRFITTEQVFIPPGVGETQEVRVTAVERGSEGNQLSETIIAIEGDLGTRLSVTNPKQTIGGSDRFSPIQTALDRKQLKSRLTDEILRECAKRIPQTLESGDVYFPDTLVVGHTRSEIYFPAEDQTGDSLSLTLDMECKAQYASGTDVKALAALELKAELPSGFVPVPGTISNTIVTPPSTALDGISQWDVETHQMLKPELNASRIMHIIHGRSPQSASQRLMNSIQLTDQPVITITPSWWPWLPFIPFRITIKTGD